MKRYRGWVPIKGRIRAVVEVPEDGDEFKEIDFATSELYNTASITGALIGAVISDFEYSGLDNDLDIELESVTEVEDVSIDESVADVGLPAGSNNQKS